MGVQAVVISPPGANTAEKLYSMNEVGYITAALRAAKVETQIIDAQNYLNNPVNLVKLLIDSKINLACIAVQWNYLFEGSWVEKFTECTEKFNKNFHITFSGRCAITYYEKILQNFRNADSVIYGEGEITIVDLYNNLSSQTNIEKIPGLVIKKDGKIHITERRLVTDNLDNLPFPARDYLEDKKNYPVVPIYTSRSCRGICIFCEGRVYRNSVRGSAYRVRSPENVINEIKFLIETYGANVLYFVDDDFFVNKKKGVERAKEIAEKIISEKIKIRFYIECRVDDVEKELFVLLKKAGLRKVLIGFESGSQSVLNRFRKQTSVHQNLKAIKILRELSINIEPSVIMFDPMVTLKEIKETLSFIEKESLFKRKLSLSIFNQLKVVPGSDAETIYKDKIIDDQQVRLLKKILKYYHAQLQMRFFRLSKKLSNHNEQSIINQKIIEHWNEDAQLLHLLTFRKIVDYLDNNNLNSDEFNKNSDLLVDQILDEFETKFQ
jgi:radical SAM superfamily enzyme YgiQ (UPF0313 family)